MTIFMVPINMIGDAELIAKRSELENKMSQTGMLTRFEAQYLDSIVGEINKRRSIE